MTTVNENFLKLRGGYLFAEIGRQVAEYKKANPQKRVISLGIGDVTRPLAPAVIEALHQATDEMGRAATFRGYGPEQGYAFLREAILEHDYRARGVGLEADDIFVSDGAKSDLGNFQELFSPAAKVAVQDPVYPVYVDSNVAGGRGDNLVYMPCLRENGFRPAFPKERPDLVYLCYPNNPTGAMLTFDELKGWVDYARAEGCVILYDSAYEAFITGPGLPHSIYEVPGAQEVAVEFRSFSKTAGFTGLRCAYTVVPKALAVGDGQGGRVALNGLWNRRQCTKYNGCAYVVQRAAEAVFSPRGQEQVRATIGAYLANAAKLRAALGAMGLDVSGGENAPYLWVAVPHGQDSFGFFRQLLLEKALVCTPGAGFGPSGEGYVRLTAFGSPDDTDEAIERLRSF